MITKGQQWELSPEESERRRMIASDESIKTIPQYAERAGLTEGAAQSWLRRKMPDLYHERFARRLKAKEIAVQVAAPVSDELTADAIVEAFLTRLTSLTEVNAQLRAEISSLTRTNTNLVNDIVSLKQELTSRSQVTNVGILDRLKSVVTSE